MERISVYVKPHDLSKYINGGLTFGFSKLCTFYSKRLLNVSKENIWRIDYHPESGTAYALKVRK